MIESEEAAAEAEGLDLDDRGEGEGVELAEASVFVEQVGHGRGGLRAGKWDLIDVVDPIDGPVMVNPVIPANPVTSGLPRASPPLLRPRMRAVIRLAEALLGDVGVDLRRGEGGVAEQALDGAEIRAGIQQMRREAVAELVGEILKGMELSLRYFFRSWSMACWLMRVRCLPRNSGPLVTAASRW